MKELICIGCPRGCHLKVDEENDYRVTGNNCNVGAEYGRNELINPTRTLTTTVRLTEGVHHSLPVKSASPIPKKDLFKAMAELDEIEVKAPVKCGEVVYRNVAGSGVDIVATRDLD
ncbi:MAG: DUF1667 domain-containing protein [Erysipelotrichaceae bacterium]|nr:DUF1667 domain-containing protein [Erysipelotrichaceae bacterium]